MDKPPIFHPLALSALRLRHPLPIDIWNSNGVLLLSKGQVIEAIDQLERLAKHQPLVRESDLQQLPDGDLSAELLRLHMRRPANTEAMSSLGARAAYLDPAQAFPEMHARLSLMLRRWDSPAWVFPEGIRAMTKHVVDLMVHRPDESLFVLLQMLQDRQVAYSAAHALLCSAICHLMAPSTGLEPSQTESLVAAALTMNLGMSRLHDQLAQQSQPVDEHQRADIQAHPALGTERLSLLGVNDRLWLQLVQDHHEDANGSGYPRRSTELHQSQRLLHMVDLFAARISPRKTRRGLMPNQAMRSLFVQSQAEHTTLGPLLVKVLGLYPPGSYVRLQGGEVAVVVRRGQRANTPVALAIVNAQGMPLSLPTLRDTERAGHAVQESVNADDVRVRMEPARVFKRA